MSHREIALEFLKRFCAGDIDATAQLMAAGLQFSGPSRRSRATGHGRDVVASGASVGSTRRCQYRIINVIENDDGDVTILYEYERSQGPLVIAQWFGFEDRRIVETQLAFEEKTSSSDWAALLRRGVRCGVGAAQALPRRAVAAL